MLTKLHKLNYLVDTSLYALINIFQLFKEDNNNDIINKCEKEKNKRLICSFNLSRLIKFKYFMRTYSMYIYELKCIRFTIDILVFIY